MERGQTLSDALAAYTGSLFAREDALLRDLNAEIERRGFPRIQIGPQQGRALQLLLRAIDARRVLEIGTLGGYSAIWMARALPADGRLVTLELHEERARLARAFFRRAGLSERVEVCVGLAADTLKRLLAEEGECSWDFEMKESYKLLHGRDVLATLDISHENLRRQCEEQIKGKFIHLRQGYIEAYGDKKALTHLIAASIEPFTEVMRNILRLKGKGAPVKKDVIIKEFSKETSLDEAPFMGALAVRREGLTPSTDALDRLYAAYLAEVGRMAEFIDKMAM